jgi:hypothetical protein
MRHRASGPNQEPRSLDISCTARNARSPERRLAVGLGIAMTMKAD